MDPAYALADFCERWACCSHPSRADRSPRLFAPSALALGMLALRRASYRHPRMHA